MKTFYSFLFFMLHGFFVFSQEASISLKGYLGVEGGESFDYNLVFTDSAGYIKGQSVTVSQAKKEVKASITGFIDHQQKTLSFQETEIIFNNGFKSYTTICLIKAGLKFLEEQGEYKLYGPITSADVSNFNCGRGSIVFTGKELKGLFENKVVAAIPEVPKKRFPEKGMKIVYDTARKTMPVEEKPKGPELITEGTDIIYEWQTDTVKFKIWDGGSEDHDLVTVLFNDQVVLKNYEIRKSGNEFFFKLPENKEIHTITIQANNEGNTPPNTADIQLTDGSQTRYLRAYNAIGKKAVIKIKRK